MYTDCQSQQSHSHGNCKLAGESRRVPGAAGSTRHALHYSSGPMSFCICMCSSSLFDTDTAELHSEVFCIQRYKRTAWRRRMAAASFDAVSESLQARATQVKRFQVYSTRTVTPHQAQ